MPFPLAAIPLAVSFFQSRKMKKKNFETERETRELIDNYKRQTLRNVYENMPLSTLGSELRSKEAARTTSTVLDTARSGGLRGVLSALPKIQESNNRVNQSNAMDLDQQFVRRAGMIAQDNGNIRQMTERREEQDLAGLGQQLYASQQNQATAQRDMNASLFMGSKLDFGSLKLGGDGLGYEPPADGAYNVDNDFSVASYMDNKRNGDYMDSLFGNSGL